MREMSALIKKSCAKRVATCARVCASMAANGACMIPFYSPEKPKELERLKKFR